MLRTVRPAAIAASLLVAALAAVALPALTATGPAVQPPKPGAGLPEIDAAAATDRFIVGFKAGSDAATDARARQRLLDTVGAAHGVHLDSIRTLATGGELLRTSRPLDRHAAKQLLVLLARDARVEYVEVDRLHRPQLRVDDERWGEQAHLWHRRDGINVAPAWRRGTGRGVVIAVLDTGITAHADLAANLVAGHDFISEGSRANDGDGRDADPSDPGDFARANQCGLGQPATASSWHGTAVAGVAAAAAGNRTGIAGVAPGAKILPVRVLGTCGGWTSDIAEAIVWSAGGRVAGVPANRTPAEVINLSFATAGGCGATTQRAIDAAHARGAVVVAAAGNDDVDVAQRAPANCRGVIAVGAAGRDGRRLAASAHGDGLDVLAPAVGVLTTTNAGTTRPGIEAYATRGGTSMSAPMVAGAAALLQARNPMAPEWVERILRRTARQAEGCKADCAAALVDVGAAAELYSPYIAIADPVARLEGNSGTQTIPFVVSLPEPLTNPVSFTFATANGTALAGSDYTGIPAHTQTLPAGTTSKTYNVTVSGDTLAENDEDFFVNLTNVQGANPVDGQARAVLTNDEPGALARNVATVVPATSAPATRSFFFVVPEGATSIRFNTANGAGDLDLYVRKGAVPTTTQYDCASTAVGNFEECRFAAGGGTYHVLVNTLNFFSESSITADYAVPNKIAIADAHIMEGDDGDSVLTFRVEHPVASDRPVTFDLASVSGTATSGIDYVALSANGQVLAGNELFREYSITIHGDTTPEPNERFKLRVTNLAGATIDDAEVEVTIANDDGPYIICNCSPSGFGEGDVNHTFQDSQLHLFNSTGEDVVVDVRTVDGTAVAGADYVAIPTTRVTLDGLLGYAPLPITIVANNVMEREEVFYLEMSNVQGATTTWERIPVRIGDDDVPMLTIKDQYILEGDSGVKSAAFLVELDIASLDPVTYDIHTEDYDAISFTQYRDYRANLLDDEVIPPGMTSRIFHVALFGDTRIEDNDALKVHLTDVHGALTPYQGSPRELVIVNDEGPTLSISDASVVEGHVGKKNLVFTVSLSEVLTVPVTFTIGQYNSDGTASGGYDYETRQPDTYTIYPGQTSRTYWLEVIGDGEPEPDETLFVDLVASTGASILGRRGKGTIVNDDTWYPTLSVTDATMDEGSSADGWRQMWFTVTMDRVANTPVQFHFGANMVAGTAEYGNDFHDEPREVDTFAIGETSRSYFVYVVGNDVAEPDEFFQVQLGSLKGASAAKGIGIGTIINDDGARLVVDDVGVSEGASGTKLMNINVRLTEPSDYDVHYTIATANGTATAGVDYIGRGPTSQTIPAGQTSQAFAVTLKGDTVAELNETLMVNLTSPTGASILDGQGIGSILNDDSPTLSIADAAITEGNSGTKVLRFTASLSEAVAVPVTYDIATANGTATAGSDYVARSLANQTIPAGSLSKTFDVTLNGDTTFESNETVLVNVSDVTGVTLLDNQAVGTILTDDGPLLSIDDVSVAEGNAGTRELTFVVRLSKPAATAVGYSISTSPGTANYADYDPATEYGRTIPAGQLSGTFAITVKGDTTVEPNETLFANIIGVTSNATVVDDQGVGTIRNDDGPTLSVDDVALLEGDAGTKIARFTARLSQAAAVPVTYSIATADGTAVAGSDYVARSLHNQTIPAGSLTRTFDVTVNGETAIEATEAFNVVLANVVGTSLLDPDGVGTITNDDGPLLSIADAAVVEGSEWDANVVRFTVSLSQASAAPVTFSFDTSPGTAVVGDYVPRNLTSQTIAAGALTKTFDVAINGDPSVEPSETFNATLSSAVGASIQDGVAVGTIINDDGPTLSVGDAAIAEGNAGTKVLRFTVSLSQAASVPVTYSIATANGTATAGSDYVARVLANQSIPAGMLSKVFDVTLNGDTALEANETFVVNLDAATGTNILDGQATGTILNDEGPTLSVGDVTLLEGEGGSQIARFTVSLSQAVAGPVTYSIATANGTATAGSDYVARSLANQSIPAGVLTKVFDVTVYGDMEFELNEAFSVNLGAVTGATVLDGQAAGMITNDDGPTVSIADVATLEGASGTKVLRFTVSLPQAEPYPVTYSIATANGTALAGSDYVARSLANQSIPAGMLSKVFDVTVNGDTAVEASETFVVTLSAVTGATVLDGQATGTISNDD